VHPLATGALAGVVASVSLRALGTNPPGGPERWERTNHAGRRVTLLEGPAYAAGAAAAAGLTGAGPGPVLAATASAGLGALDDLAGDSSSKGLKGHFGALARGEVTTGAVKVLGLGVTGLATAALVDRDLRRSAARSHGSAAPAAVPTAVDTLVGGAVVAGTANLLNLLDLRPGRALKATILGAAAIASSRGTRDSLRAGAAATSAAAAAGAALGLLAPDLRGEAMLGDTGANSAGALLGTALVQAAGRRGRLVALAVLTGLTLASEKVSFTQVIESTPVLREVDALGRR
jgi:UDP-N-acetylmuramyl pentapeptide phosphotransferase/UDP-N-acetylglucosamine-1-phosphate transferase